MQTTFFEKKSGFRDVTQGCYAKKKLLRNMIWPFFVETCHATFHARNVVQDVTLDITQER